MLATGGSALCAVEVLLQKGAKISDITFFNVVSCPEGLARFAKEAPGLKVCASNPNPNPYPYPNPNPNLGGNGLR